MQELRCIERNLEIFHAENARACKQRIELEQCFLSAIEINAKRRFMAWPVM